MLRRTPIGGVHEHVGIYHKHLAAFHRSIQRVSVGYVDKGAAAVEGGQGGKGFSLAPLLKHLTERRFDQLGHGTAGAGGLASKPGHHAIVDVKGGLHMDNHIIGMGVGQTAPR
jgi:hypothetical protein